MRSRQLNAINKILDRPDWLDDQRPVGVPTGFADLDAVTGGLVPGQVWLVTGAPGVGLSMFVRGLARTAALAGKATNLVCEREPEDEIALTMVSAQSRVAELAIRRGSLDEEERERVERAMAQLGATSLQILGNPVQFGVPNVAARLDVSPLVSRHDVCAYAEIVVVEDLDALARGSDVWAVLEALRRSARSAPLALVITLPRELVMTDAVPFDLAVRNADVVLELTRDDQDDCDHPTAGEGVLRVVRNRYGPTARVRVAYQSHYRRILGFATAPPF